MWKLSQGLLYAILIVLTASGAYARGGPLHLYPSQIMSYQRQVGWTRIHNPAGASICFRHAHQTLPAHPGEKCTRSRPWE
jgi:hypothetical protein